jgi:hypothetical protein
MNSGKSSVLQKALGLIKNLYLKGRGRINGNPIEDKNRVPKNASTKPPRGMLLPLLEVFLTKVEPTFLSIFPERVQ